MLKQILNNRYALLAYFILGFICVSFLLRTGLLMFSLEKTEFSIAGILRIYVQGLIFDLAVALLLSSTYQLYLLLLPEKLVGSVFNKVATYIWLTLMLFICFLSFFAEVTFWQEFESRFNFIAVDYLIYTYEVINNINESYPLPILIGGVLLLVLFAFLFLKRLAVFQRAFKKGMVFKKRVTLSGTLLIVTILTPLLLSNSNADVSENRYENELAKAGIFSFFSAFKNNELNYNDFYRLIPDKLAFQLVRSDLKNSESTLSEQWNSIKRSVKNPAIAYKPNVIMITVESLSADFLGYFGNQKHLTPVLDSLAQTNLIFTNMYATGTRTVRGMEALSLSVPPTPGSSIVRRPNNDKLTTVGYIFEQEGYTRTFYYGGDGYFDNMNEYFGKNGFDITDRGRKLNLGDSYSTHRKLIADNEIQFENAWGICDEDLFNTVVKGSDESFNEGKPFFNFVMTTSNHRPFTFPANKINMPQGNREGAVRYTDYAIGQFLNKIKRKPWYKNTVVIIIADHCASSAGKNEIDVSKYHIPCMVVNLPNQQHKTIDSVCSQIDLYPTLFNILGWSYQNNLYGQDVLEKTYKPRAFLSTYQKLAYLSGDSLVILGPQQQVETFKYNKLNNQQITIQLNKKTVEKAIAYYQTAYDLFKKGGLKQ